MKKLSFEYEMQLDYSVKASRCNYTIKCIPQSNFRQRVEGKSIELFPNSHYFWGKDGLGNQQIYGVNETEHTSFIFRISGIAETGLAAYEEGFDENRDMVFRHPHGLNEAGESIKAYYESLKSEIDLMENEAQKAVFLMHQLHQTFHYEAFCTNNETTAEEAFVQGKGVCQDYAHILISLLHLAGIAARYVTGFLIGEGASHAWVEYLMDGKWYGLDPTNDVYVFEDHIRIGKGRDAKDCMINRGVMIGGGLHTQKIKVSVKEVDYDKDSSFG